MQPMSGLEFLLRLRDPVASPKPYNPVIMLTGYSAEARVVQARDFGTTEFLTKPVTARALYASLVELVDNPRMFVRTSKFFGPCRRRTKSGRASCRERVCQYGKISVVAVSLKHKKGANIETR